MAILVAVLMYIVVMLAIDVNQLRNRLSYLEERLALDNAGPILKAAPPRRTYEPPTPEERARMEAEQSQRNYREWRRAFAGEQA